MSDKTTPPAKPDDPQQSKRFIDMAREVGADERPEAIDEVFNAVVSKPHDKTPKKSGLHKT